MSKPSVAKPIDKLPPGTRDRLIELGLTLFGQRGYHGTGLKLIVDAAAVPKGSFYNHFTSKEAFAAEVIDAYVAQRMALFDEIVVAHADDPPMDRLRTFHRSLIRLLRKDDWRYGCLLGGMAAEFASTSTLCSAALRKGCGQWQHRVAALFEEAQQRGEIRADFLPGDMAAHIWNVWQGALLRMQYEGTGEGLEQTVEFTLQQFSLQPTTQARLHLS